MRINLHFIFNDSQFSSDLVNFILDGGLTFMNIHSAREFLLLYQAQKLILSISESLVIVLFFLDLLFGLVSIGKASV